jgi:hypothetical protein
MKVVKSFGSAFCTALALVLFSLAISNVLASSKTCSDHRDCMFSKTASLPVNAQSQLPYEEKETETDDEGQDNCAFTYLVSEPLFFSLAHDTCKCCDLAHSPIDAVKDIPLYLSGRVFLI